MAVASLNPLLTLFIGDEDVSSKERERSSRSITFLREKAELWTGRHLCGVTRGVGIRHKLGRDTERVLRTMQMVHRFPQFADEETEMHGGKGIV